MEPNPQCDALEWFKVLAPVGTWLIVVVGWWIVDRQNNRRETRKEKRAKLDRVQKDIVELETAACAYHTGLDHSESSAREIVVSIQRISNDVMGLSLLDPTTENDALISMRRSITLRNFDLSTHKPLDPSSTLIREVSDSAQALMTILELGFQKRYQGS